MICRKLSQDSFLASELLVIEYHLVDAKVQKSNITLVWSRMVMPQSKSLSFLIDNVWNTISWMPNTTKPEIVLERPNTVEPV